MLRDTMLLSLISVFRRKRTINIKLLPMHLLDLFQNRSQLPRLSSLANLRIRKVLKRPKRLYKLLSLRSNVRRLKLRLKPAMLLRQRKIESDLRILLLKRGSRGKSMLSP
jgi:hypothetical protein